MQYTLADFYQYNQVPGLRLLTKPFDFSKICIASASYVEMPTDDFICSNELVLSTGAGCDTDKELYVQMIRFAAEAHASAIIYTLRDENYDIPDSAIAYADQMKMPIFYMPWEYRLSDVHAFVVQQIQDKKLQVYQQIQNTLFSLFFDSRSLDCAAGELSEAFGVPVVVLDRLGRREGSGRLQPSYDAEAEKIEIRMNGELSGWLCLYEPEVCRELLSNLDALEKFVLSPLSLWFYRKNLEDMTVMKLKNNFVWDLANGNYDSLEEMSRQGRKLNFDLNCPYTCALLQVAAREPECQIQEYSDEAARSVTAIETTLLETGRSMNLRLMVADRNLHFLLYVENATEAAGRTPGDFVDAVEERLSQAFPTLTFYWGISETTPKAPDFCRLYHNASLALQYCMSAKSNCQRFTFKDTQMFQILSILSDHPEIQQTSRDVLGSLLEYGASSRMDLMNTLTEYIKCNYNTSLTARNLHIHRQSLLYRLEKIEGITGLSLTDHKDLFLLETYARIFSDF